MDEGKVHGRAGLNLPLKRRRRLDISPVSDSRIAHELRIVYVVYISFFIKTSKQKLLYCSKIF